MRRLVLFALLVPGLAFAQRPGMGMGRGRTPGNIARDPGIVVTKPVNMINLLIEHRQELALGDSQFARIIVIKRALDSTNAPFARRLDSLQRLFKPAPLFSEPSPQRRDSLAAARGVVQEMVADIDDNIAEAREKAFMLLSTPQLTIAEQIEEKARKASAATGRGRS